MASDEPQALHQLKQELLLLAKSQPPSLPPPKQQQQQQQQPPLVPAVTEDWAWSDNSSICDSRLGCGTGATTRGDSRLGCGTGATTRGPWAGELLWWLQHYCLFHTAKPHKYDAELLDCTVMSLFGITVPRQPVVLGK
jgi:hypothetical protein